MTQAISLPKADKPAATGGEKAWKVAPRPGPAAKAPLFRRILGRAEPTTYQRCLAIHLHFASPRGGLS
jgi:hypothetical protein